MGEEYNCLIILILRELIIENVDNLMNFIFLVLFDVGIY